MRKVAALNTGRLLFIGKHVAGRSKGAKSGHFTNIIIMLYGPKKEGESNPSPDFFNTFFYFFFYFYGFLRQKLVMLPGTFLYGFKVCDDDGLDLLINL